MSNIFIKYKWEAPYAKVAKKKLQIGNSLFVYNSGKGTGEKKNSLNSKILINEGSWV